MEISMMYTILTCVIILFIIGLITLLFISPTIGVYIMFVALISLFVVGIAPMIKPPLLNIYWTIHIPK